MKIYRVGFGIFGGGRGGIKEATVKPKHVIFKKIIKFLLFRKVNIQYSTCIEVTPSGLDTIRPLQLTSCHWQDCCMCWIGGTFIMMGTDYAKIQKLFFN